MELAVIWHYWIGVVFFILSLLVVVAVAVGYLVKVQSLKYPKRTGR
jgi:Na+-transporting methylmalonyl-CoA/oxaloacetate decarboxylase gamma subunit